MKKKQITTQNIDKNELNVLENAKKWYPILKVFANWICIWVEYSRTKNKSKKKELLCAKKNYQ